MSAVLDEFVETCRTLAVGDRSVAEIAQATERLVADPVALASQIPDPVDGPDASVTGVDEIVFEDATVTVFVVHTRPGVIQPPHDHLISAVIGVYRGAEVQRYFRRSENTIVPSGGATIAAGGVLTLGPAAIHAISSADATWCSAVHVYLGGLSAVDRSLFDPDTFTEEPMDGHRYEQFCRTESTS